MSTLLGPSGQAISSKPDAPTSAGSPSGVTDTTTATFAQDVIEPSRQTVVVVDFWAPWCGPCRDLAPALETAVAAFGGAVRLVKMNIDEEPEIAQQIGIRSIPAVIAFRQGQPMDGFVGVKSQSEVRAFLERLAGPANDGLAELLAEAEAAREANDFERAMAAYGEVLRIDPANVAAIGGIGLTAVAAGDLEQAHEVLAQIPQEMRREPPIEAFEAALALAQKAGSLSPADELRAKVEADPADSQARFDLAVALAGAGDKAGAVEELIAIMRRDREWNEGAAQKELVAFFEAWGPKDPATITGRRKMASILFA